jgi:tetratricopeptide (TPR) repeat protein
MPNSLRWSVLLLAVFVAGCVHARPATSAFVHGRPPAYRFPADAGSEPTDAFVARVRRAQAESLAARPRTAVVTLETNDLALKQSLADLASVPDASHHREVASRYFRLGVRDFAEDHFSAALALDKRDGASYEMRARIWRDWGFPARSLSDAHRAVYYTPDSPSAQNTLGTVFQRLRQYEPARRAYRKALRLDPRAAYALANLCSLDLLDGHAEQAVATCGEALALDAGSALARSNLERAQSIVLASAAGERNDHQ